MIVSTTVGTAKYPQSSWNTSLHWSTSDPDLSNHNLLHQPDYHNSNGNSQHRWPNTPKQRTRAEGQRCKSSLRALTPAGRLVSSTQYTSHIQSDTNKLKVHREEHIDRQDWVAVSHQVQTVKWRPQLENLKMFNQNCLSRTSVQIRAANHNTLVGAWATYGAAQFEQDQGTNKLEVSGVYLCAMYQTHCQLDFK